MSWIRERIPELIIAAVFVVAASFGLIAGLGWLQSKIIELSGQVAKLDDERVELEGKVKALQIVRTSLESELEKIQSDTGLLHEAIETNKLKANEATRLLESFADSEKGRLLRKIEQIDADDTVRTKSTELLGKLTVLENRSFFLDCKTTMSTTNPQVASCPPGYLVAGCSAGSDRGSISHNETNCQTQAPTDWTQARCCRITQVSAQ